MENQFPGLFSPPWEGGRAHGGSTVDRCCKHIDSKWRQEKTVEGAAKIVDTIDVVNPLNPKIKI